LTINLIVFVLGLYFKYQPKKEMEIGKLNSQFLNKCMKNILLILSLLLVHWPAYSRITNLTNEQQKKTRKMIAECRFALSAKVVGKMGQYTVPTAARKTKNYEGPESKFFKFSRDTLGASIMFPGFLLAVPFAFLADILWAPVSGIQTLVEKGIYKYKTNKSKEALVADVTDFKKQWETIEPNRFKRHQLMIELYVLQFQSDVHKWLTKGGGQKYTASAEGKQNYDFIMPYIYKSLGQKPFFNKATNSWRVKYGHINEDMNLHFDIEDFVLILDENPKLCASPGLDALDIIGEGYGKIIKPQLGIK
jgi:hypothetical protein